MSSEDRPTDEVVAEIVSTLPIEIHFSGGPYCGFFLHPHHECIHDVHSDGNDDPQMTTNEFRPTSWGVWSFDFLVLRGPLGAAVYRMESERVWRFHAFAQEVPEPSL